MAAIDGKQIANMLYHAGVETVLTIGYVELGKDYTQKNKFSQYIHSVHFFCKTVLVLTKTLLNIKFI